MLKRLLSLLVLTTFSFTSHSQTTLAPGDILFTSYNAIPGSGTADTFSFVALVPISSSTVIYFTDRGYFGGVTWQTIAGTEGTVSWTSATAISVGQEVEIRGLAAFVNGIANGTVTVVAGGNPTSGLSLSNAGDQILAFQGGGGDPTSGAASFKAGINWSLSCGNTTDAGWADVTCSYGPQTSAMPPGLTGGTDAFLAGPAEGSTNHDHAKFNCTGTPYSSVAALKTAILNKANWTFGGATGITTFNVPPGCNYYATCTNPTINTPPSSTTVCNTGNTSFTIAATGATGFQWQVNTGSGFGNITNGGVYSNATTATLNITGATAGMSGYLYRCIASDGACSTTSSQATLTVSNPTLTANSQTNVSCFGGNNGAAAVNAAGGGISPYTYNWTGTPTGDGTTSITGLTAQTWTCTVTDNIGCTASVNFNVTAPPAIVLNANAQTNVSCFGGNNGAASVQPASGGAGGYTYNWTPLNPTGDGTVSVTGLTAQTYTCTVTDANSCTQTRNFTITAPPAIVVTPNSQTNVACFGGNTGAASINTPTGGAGGYTYNWTPLNPTGDGTVSVTGLTAQTYTCTVTDANSCTAAQNFTITSPTVITASISSTPTGCVASNGTASVSGVSGGAGGYTYSWSPSGGTAATATNLGAGTYTCTITDVNGCSIAPSVVVSTIASPTLTAASQTNVSCFGGSNGAASVNAATGGAGGYTYDWTPGTPTGDGTTSITGLSATTYTCTVTDANGCTASVNFTITAPTALALTAASQTNVSCFSGSNGAASVNAASGGAGGYTYDWTPGTPTGDGTTSITGLTDQTYTCTVTDANGCTATQNFTITAPPALLVTPASQTNVACFGGSTGAASINVPTGGAGGYTYDWTPGTPTGDGTVSVTGLTAQTYTCTVTDANGCTAAQNFTITAPPALSVTPASQTNVACFGGSTGAASINVPTGGAGGYTYDWTPGTPTGDGTISITGLTDQTYTCTVTDLNGCTATQNFTITSPTAITASISSTQTGCTVNNGTATVSAVSGGAGGYTYDWSPGTPTGDGTTSISGIGTGTYTCSITDVNGCSIAPSVAVTTIAGPSLTAAAQTNVACFGGSNGAASVNAATGGAGGYTYDWTPGTPAGDGTLSVSGLNATTYTCTVTDLNGCTANTSFTITQPPALAANAAVTSNYNGAQISCFGSSDGVITVVPSGGAGGYTYDWSPGTPAGDGTATITGLGDGTYSVIVTDANGCNVTSNTVTLSAPLPLTVAFMPQTNVSCFGGSNGSASVNVIGGTGFYTYDWAPGTPTGDGTNTVSGLTAGVWSCTITDANGCINVVTFTITEPSQLVLNASAVSHTDVTCFGASDGTASVDPASGGAGGYTYDWTPGNPTGDGTTSVTGLAPNTYTCTVTDVNGCTASQTFTITEPAATPPTAVCQNVTIYLDATGNASIVAADIDGGSTVACGSLTLSASQTTFTCADLGANTVILTATSPGGSSTCNAIVTILDTIAPTASNPATLQVECADDAIVDVTDITDENDNCGTPTVTFVSDVSDGQTCPETITRTYNVEDASGNSVSVTQTIIVNDVTPPTAPTPATLNAQCTNLVPAPLPSWVSGEVDNCSPTVVAWVSDQSNGLSCPETITRTFSVTDVCNNSINVMQTIIVMDTQAPTADVASLPELTGNCSLTPSTATASDNCAGTINGTPDVAFPITAFGTTTITWTYVDDCGNTTTQTQDVTLTPIDVTTHMANDGITFVVNNLGQTYQWIDCATGQPIAGATNHNFTPTYGSDFAVIITQNGCSDTSSCMNSTVGLEEAGIRLLTLYPNPTDAFVTVQLDAADVQLELMDANGKTLQTSVFTNETTLNLTAYPVGVYLIRVKTDDQIIVKRVVKQ